MVSFLNNTGIRLCFSKDASLPQYPYVLYDSTYQNQMNSQPNLLYPQNLQETEQKKTKTSKKKGENEKNAKETSASLDCAKEDITSWLKSLTLEERFEVFSIKSSWLAVALAKMYRRRAESHDITFRLLPEDNATNGERNGLEFSDLETHFYCRRSLVEKQIHIDKAEDRLVQNIRIYDDKDFYNVIVFRDDLLQNIDEVLQLFDIISGKKAFIKPCHTASEHKSSTISLEKPGWFKSNEFATLGEWIVSSFEKAIWIKYLQNKKASSKYPSALEAFDSHLTLSYKKSLTQFWSGLEKNMKKKICATANETYRWLNSPDSEQKCYENGKDINQCLKKLYEGSLFEQSRSVTTTESINAEFSKLVEERNDHSVVEFILMTNLSNFGTITSLICRKLAHKLKNMLSEKIAADLILNEEREKKNSIKKKSKKKKNKKLAQKNDNSEVSDTAQMKKAEGEGIIEEAKPDNFSTTSIQNRVQVEDDLVVEDISDEETVKRTVTEVSRKNSEISTKIYHTSPIAPVANPKNKKKDNQNNEKTKVSEETKIQAKNEKVEEKTNKIENETKRVEDPKKNEIDSWSQFDEFDKKVSKSQKRKMKKKQKNLEQEKVKSQENEIENQNENENKNQEENSIEDKRESSIERLKESHFSLAPEAQTQIQENKEIESNIPISEPVNNAPNKNEPKSKKSKKENQLTETKTIITGNKKENETMRNTTPKSPNKTSPTQKALEIKAKSPHKEEPIIKNVSMPPPVDDSEFGFIEVKAKKKQEKEAPQKERRDREAKGNPRRKKQKEESDNRKSAKGTRRPKSPSQQSEVKKEHNEALPSKAIVIEKNVVVKCIANETVNKNSIGIPRVITGAALASKALASKSQKKETIDVQLEGSSNSSEGEGTPCNTRNTSHTSRSSHNPNRSPNEPCTDNVPERKYSANNKVAHRGHPLSLASPSLDLETIKTAQAKDYANKYFNKKFETDIFKYVSALTVEANKMTDYRIVAYRRLDYCIASLFPNFNVQTKIFGSCATGLALITSDIDISVSGLEAYDRFALGDYLLLISNSLDQFKWITVNEPILTASVPILKLEIDLNLRFGDTKEGQNNTKLWNIPLDNKDELNIEEKALKKDFKIRVDLSVESLGMGYNYHSGYKTTAFVQRMLAKYESLYIVTMVLKQFLHTRKLLNIFKGGLSSYCLVIMIVALLQKFGDEGYMTTLRRFFNFYGEVFKPESQGISLIDKDPFFSLGHSYETAPFWIIVENSFGRKNIGQGVYAIKAILHEFAEASHKIESTRKRIEESAAKNHNAVHSVDDIPKIENDTETQVLLSSNILELIINCP